MMKFFGPDKKKTQYTHPDQWESAHRPRQGGSGHGSHTPLHWKDGRSAKLVAQAWGYSGDIPWRVRAALEKVPQLSGLIGVRGDVECAVPVPGHGRASVTDLMVASRGPDAHVVLAVEAKVDEGFGDIVRQWRQAGGTPAALQNRTERLQGLCDALGLPVANADLLPYQLLHRAYSGLRYGEAAEADRVVCLVHSFLPAPKILDDDWKAFRAFARALSPGAQPILANTPWRVGNRQVRDGGRKQELWLCWVSDAGGVVSP